MPIEHEGPRPAAMALPMIGLLVMLLLVAMGIPPAIGEPDLPSARTATPVARGAATVGVDRNGSLWIDGAHEPGSIPQERVAARLRDAYALRGDRSRVLHLWADPHAPYERVQAVLRVAVEAGTREVVLIACCPSGTESLLRGCNR